MPKAIWHDAVLAQSDATIVVEGRHYFPPDSIVHAHFRPSATRTVCGSKGTASYFDVVVGDAVNPDAAWCYPSAKAEAKSIEGYVAFWHGVTIEN